MDKLEALEAENKRLREVLDEVISAIRSIARGNTDIDVFLNRAEKKLWARDPDSD